MRDRLLGVVPVAVAVLTVSCSSSELRDPPGPPSPDPPAATSPAADVMVGDLRRYARDRGEGMTWPQLGARDVVVGLRLGERESLSYAVTFYVPVPEGWAYQHLCVGENRLDAAKACGIDENALTTGDTLSFETTRDGTFDYHLDSGGAGRWTPVFGTDLQPLLDATERADGFTLEPPH